VTAPWYRVIRHDHVGPVQEAFDAEAVDLWRVQTLVVEDAVLEEVGIDQVLDVLDEVVCEGIDVTFEGAGGRKRARRNTPRG
jgi:hypothetical protein